MSISVTINGQNFEIPETGEIFWGDETTGALVELADSTLQLSTTQFPLSAQLDFTGPNLDHGLIVGNISSQPITAAGGFIRMNNTDTINWRNAGDTADIVLGVTGDQLSIGGVVISTDFIGLTDTPVDYTGQSGKLVSVLATEDGVEFIDPSTVGVTDHTLLTSIGVNTHAQIDTHIADGTIHFTEGSIDHTAISNIGTNSHTVIDSHLANTGIHFSVASIDHTAITNIGTNSHAQLDSHLADGTIHFTEGSISHLNIGNIGTNSHAAIDSHIADGTIHFTQAAISITASQVSDFSAAADARIGLANIDDLADVVITTPVNGEALVYSGGNWVNATSTAPVDSVFGRIGAVVATEGDYALTQMSDVLDSMIPLDGQVLTFDTTNGWQAETNVSGVTDHTLLSNIGVNTHPQIDTHISDSTIHFTEASIVHQNISGAGTNTHAQLDTHVADGTIHFTEGSIAHGNITGIGTNTHAQLDTHLADGTIHFTQGAISITASQVSDFDSAADARIAAAVLDDIGDVSVTTGLAIDGYHLYWDDLAGMWQAEAPPAAGVTDHTLLSNIGVNTHPQIDTHIGDATIHFTESSIDHTAIANIGTNSHAQLDTHVGDATIHFTEGSIDHTAIANIGTNSHAQLDSHVADATIHFTEASIDHLNIQSIGVNTHADIDTFITDTEAQLNFREVQITGVVSGGNTVEATTTTIDVAAGVGHVIDSYTDPDNPTNIDFTWSAVTGMVISMPDNIGIQGIFVDQFGVVQQQPDVLTNNQRRTLVQIAVVEYRDGTIRQVDNSPRTINNVGNTLGDLINFKSINDKILGLEVQPVDALLSVWVREGQFFAVGINHDVDPKNPNVADLPQKGDNLTPITFDVIFQDGTTYLAGQTVIPEFYESAPGVATALTSNNAVIHYMFRDLSDSYLLQLGQTLYTDGPTARSSLDIDITTYDTFDGSDTTLLSAQIYTQATTSDFSDPDQAGIRNLLGGVGGSVSGGGSSTFLDLSDTPSTYVGESLKYLRVDATEIGVEFATLPSPGEVNTSSNLGAGEGLATAKSGVDLPFKSLVAGSNITFTASSTEILIDAASGGVTWPLLAPDSSSSNPSYSFSSNNSVGMTYIISDGGGVGIGGSGSSVHLTVTNQRIVAGVPIESGALNGKSLADPIITYQNSAGVLGMYFPIDVATRTIAFGMGSVERLRFKASGVLSVEGTTDYETLVTFDDAVPNKKYVDEKVEITDQQTQTGTSYTAVLTDSNEMITMNNAAANTMTIPANSSVAYPVGTKLNIMQLGAGQTTIAITTDTLNVEATLTLKLTGQYAVATAFKVTSTTWVLFGNLEAA